MFRLDTQTGEIRIPSGDTALFKIKLTGGTLPEGTMAVFGVCSSKGRYLLTKAFEVNNGEIIVRLTNQDTRVLKDGNYLWDTRIVTDPDINEAGEVRAYDPGDNVYSIFSGVSAMPPFVVTSIAAEV